MGIHSPHLTLHVYCLLVPRYYREGIYKYRLVLCPKQTHLGASNELFVCSQEYPKLVEFQHHVINIVQCNLTFLKLIHL